MNPSENSSKEPKHLGGLQKTCPRLDCPNPTIGIVWRGSSKQLQYHCYGCWRKFNYGGILRSWVKQVSPPNWWLRLHAPDVKEPPKLLDIQPPCGSGPSRERTPSQRSVAKSSAEDDTTNAMHAAEPSQKRTRRTNVNHVINEKGKTAIATSGEDHGIGMAGSSTMCIIDVATQFNGFGDEEAHRGPGTPTTPTSDNTNDIMNDLDDLFDEDGVHTPVWQSFVSPVAHNLWDDEVDGAGIVSAAATDSNPIVHGTSGLINAASGDVTEPRRSAGIVSVAATDNNPIVQGTRGLINAASGDVTEPRRRAMTITFRRYSVPSKTFYNGLQG